MQTMWLFLRLSTGVHWHHRHLVSERKYPEIYSVYFTGSYSLDYSAVRHSLLHYLLLVLISGNFEWSPHLNNVLTKAYKTLGLIHRIFSQSMSPLVKVKLYISLITSQIMYWSPVWCPHLTTTKYILHDYIQLQNTSNKTSNTSFNHRYRLLSGIGVSNFAPLILTYSF